jgi:hypothetical protein
MLDIVRENFVLWVVRWKKIKKNKNEKIHVCIAVTI